MAAAARAACASAAAEGASPAVDARDVVAAEALDLAVVSPVPCAPAPPSPLFSLPRGLPPVVLLVAAALPVVADRGAYLISSNTVAEDRGTMNMARPGETVAAADEGATTGVGAAPVV